MQLANIIGILYHALTSKFSCKSQKVHSTTSLVLTSEKYVVTTVRSANFLPASAFSAAVVDSIVSNLTKILPTPVDCRLPPDGRGTFISRIRPYFSHSSRTSSQISAHS